MPPPAQQRRAAVLDRLASERTAGRPVVVAGIGTGLTARSALEGGADLVVAYHSAPFRFAGRSSIAGLMPFGNANAMVREMAHGVLSALEDSPALATVCAADPTVDTGALLGELAGLGFAGVMNAPTAVLIDGALREELEHAGLGFGAELELIGLARARELVTCAYASSAEDAAALAKAGADIVVAHLGVTRARDDDVAAEFPRLQAIAAAAGDRLVLCHGGAIATPEDFEQVLAADIGVGGYFGASSLEATPVRAAVYEASRAFKSARPMRRP
jgi:predicted TIM-barrel enzyme